VDFKSRDAEMKGSSSDLKSQGLDQKVQGSVPDLGQPMPGISLHMQKTRHVKAAVVIYHK